MTAFEAKECETLCKLITFIIHILSSLLSECSDKTAKLTSR